MADSPAHPSEGRRTATRFPRPVAFTLVAILALILANTLYFHLNQARMPLSGGPGELLYAAAFDGFFDEWELYDGQQSASIVDGRLQLTVASPHTATWSTTRHHFANFDISVAARAAAGPIDNAFGILFAQRGPSDERCDLPAIIFCGLESWLPLLGAALRQVLDHHESAHYYAFLISSDGYYALLQTENGQQTWLSAWMPSSFIQQNLGAQNRIRVRARGSWLEFFINGEPAPLCLPEDPDASSTFANGECVGGTLQNSYQAHSAMGKLGLIAQATFSGGGGLVIDFDNLIVISPALTDQEDAKL